MKKECENADCLECKNCENKIDTKNPFTDDECSECYYGKSATAPVFFSGDEWNNLSKEECKKCLLRIGDFIIYLIAYFLLFYIPVCFFVQTYQNIVWLIGLFK